MVIKMVYQKYYNCKHHHHHHLGEIDRKFRRKVMMEDSRLSKRAKSKFVSLLCFSFLCCSFIWVSQIFGVPSSLSCLLLSDTPVTEEFVREDVGLHLQKVSNAPVASLVSNGAIQCDKSHFRTNVCYMKGDIRTNSSASSIFLYTLVNSKFKSLDSPPRSLQEDVEDEEFQHEIIRPYTRKWETSVMDTIDRLHLISKHKPSNSNHECDVLHDVPAVFFSTGGYTGNVYHEFNDGLIPLYITSRHFNKKVVFVILEYHDWWYMKYGRVISQLSHYPIIDYKDDPRTHCFHEAIVGLKIHNELAIDSSIMENNETILGFRDLIGQAFEPAGLAKNPSGQLGHGRRPRLVILSRSGSRRITNQNLLVKLAENVGFHVQVLKPKRDTDLAIIYKAISNSDLMVGVHGAAMTHFLFLNPGSTVIQVIPLGTDWAAETYYGEPSKKFGLKYIGYKIHPTESSLYHKYGRNDPVLRDPDSVNRKGWEYTKRIYLEDQYVTLDLKRFKKILISEYRNHLIRSKGN